MVVPISSKSAADVSSAILDFWVKVYGALKKFYTNKGAEFTTTLTCSLFRNLGNPTRFTHLENHQANPVECFHQTLYALVKSLGQEGEAQFISIVRTAVMLKNASVHSTLGMIPNQLQFGYDFRDNPADLVLGRPALGPADGEPSDLVANIRQEIDLVVKIASGNTLIAIQWNAWYYQNQFWTGGALGGSAQAPRPQAGPVLIH